MSEADKLFEELGFKKYIDSCGNIVFITKFKEKIIFDIRFKQFIVETENGQSYPISMQELQVIYKKCRELGWIE